MFSKSIQEYVCYLTGCQGGATLRFVSILHPNPSPKRHLHRWPRAWQRTKLNRGPHARVKLPITSRQVNIQANSPGNCTRAMKITVLAQICGKQLLPRPRPRTHTHIRGHMCILFISIDLGGNVAYEQCRRQDSLCWESHKEGGNSWHRNRNRAAGIWQRLLAPAPSIPCFHIQYFVSIWLDFIPFDAAAVWVCGFLTRSNKADSESKQSPS